MSIVVLSGILVLTSCLVFGLSVQNQGVSLNIYGIWRTLAAVMYGQCGVAIVMAALLALEMRRTSFTPKERTVERDRMGDLV
jgi:hypothetical protein